MVDLATTGPESRQLYKPADPAGLNGASAMVVTPDGQSFSATYLRVLSELYSVQGIK